MNEKVNLPVRFWKRPTIPLKRILFYPNPGNVSDVELALFLTIKALIVTDKIYLFDMQGGKRAVFHLFTALKRLKIICNGTTNTYNYDTRRRLNALEHEFSNSRCRNSYYEYSSISI